MQSSSEAAQTTSTQVTSTPSQEHEISVANVNATVDEKKEGSVADTNCKGGESELNPVSSESSNDAVPPNQAFANPPVVHQGMPALENQFQSMGMDEVPITVHHDKEGHNGENDDDQPVKLFVGQVRYLVVGAEIW